MKRLSIALLMASLLGVPSVLADSGTEAQAIKALQSSAIPAEKEAACRQLKRIGTAKAVPALVSLLSDDLLAQWALDVLVTMPCPEAGEALRAALRTTVRKPRVGVVHALGERRDRQALPELIRLMSDADVLLASSAATAVSKIGGADAIDALKKAKAAAAAPVRAAIADALLACAKGLLAGGDATAALALYREVYGSKEAERFRVAAYRGIVLSSGDRAVSLVVGALRGGDRAAKLASIQLVPELAGENATAAFAGLLAGAAPKIQVALLDALSLRGDPAAAAAVRAAVRSPDRLVRIAALKALMELGDASHVPLLAECAVSGTDAERAAARYSLVNLRRGDVHGAMLSLIDKARPEVQGKVLAVLGSRGERAAVPALLKLAAADKEPVNVAAISALRKLAGAPHAEALLGLIVRASSDSVREAALSTFVTVGARCEQREDFVRRALAAMQGAEVAVRCALLKAAGQLGGPGVLDALRAGARDASPQIRGVAIRTMADHAGVKALPDLLAFAREASDKDQQASALQGYWRLVGLMKIGTPEQHLKRVRDGLAAGKQPDAKRRALAELAKIPLPEAMEMAQQARGDDAVKADAESACYQIATRLIYSHRPAVETTLRRLTQGAGSEAVRNNAKAFLASLEKHADFVVPWLVAGPYRQKGKEAQGLFGVVFPPEKPGAPGVTWRVLPAPPEPPKFWQAILDGVVGGNHCVVYAKTKVFCPKAQPVSLEIGSDDGIKLWINGQLVHANNAVRGMTPAQDKAKANLKQGWNDFVAKITQHTAGCGLVIRITAANGSRIDGLRCDPKGE